ncbi:hypothetical protein [Legionella sp. PC997]|uniref:hypothetical protein n=1 Tax=Legionella sp. PC997 TaxID=2755562 RepID=UPI00185F6BCA|nr:hypothetical protein [Legionella sp. PC997]QMT58901.1 hypothetical protein HBNCFIEN_00256 [Legionella sp. PC997]
MIQNKTQFSSWFVTDNDRAKTLVKHELKMLNNELQRNIETTSNPETHPEVRFLCHSIANKYLDYLQLLDQNVAHIPQKLGHELSWSQRFNQIALLEQKLASPLDIEEQIEHLQQIISLYQCVPSTELTNQVSLYSMQLQRIFSERELSLWLEGFVDFLNKSDIEQCGWGAVFYDWNVEQQHLALDFFANPKCADLVNEIFFYKVHPDKLFAEVMHPEKLVSIQMRLGILHYYIDSMQQKLYEIALQKGFGLGVDYFLRDEELPQGVRIETSDVIIQMIQSAVKRLKLSSNPINAKRDNVNYVSDLKRAYKFCFNPNRLVDAVMILQQNLLSGAVGQKNNILLFQEKMMALYNQLTTTECLDLYGYFANNDTQQLLYTFFNITRGGTFDWLPLLNNDEKIAIQTVFDALLCVMDALRIELGNRHFLTESYMYDLTNSNLKLDYRNRDAVFRVITLYKRMNTIPDNAIEQLFQSIEDCEVN